MGQSVSSKISNGPITQHKPSKPGRVLVALGEGCYFGEVPLIIAHQSTRSGSAQAIEVSTLYSLSRGKLKELLVEYPDTGKYMLLIAARRLCRATNLKVATCGEKAGTAIPMLPDAQLDEEDLKTLFFQKRMVQRAKHTETAARIRWGLVREQVRMQD